MTAPVMTQDSLARSSSRDPGPPRQGAAPGPSGRARRPAQGRARRRSGSRQWWTLGRRRSPGADGPAQGRRRDRGDPGPRRGLHPAEAARWRPRRAGRAARRSPSHGGRTASADVTDGGEPCRLRARADPVRCDQRRVGYWIDQFPLSFGVEYVDTQTVFFSGPPTPGAARRRLRQARSTARSTNSCTSTSTSCSTAPGSVRCHRRPGDAVHRRARVRPSCAEPARYQRADASGAAGRPAAGQSVLGGARAAGRLLRRRLGARCQ